MEANDRDSKSATQGLKNTGSTADSRTGKFRFLGDCSPETRATRWGFWEDDGPARAILADADTDNDGGRWIRARNQDLVEVEV